MKNCASYRGPECITKTITPQQLRNTILDTTLSPAKLSTYKNLFKKAFFMRSKNALLFFISVIMFSGILCPNTSVTQKIDSSFKKKERFIGSAWQQALQHVYIASSDVTTQPRPIEKPKETPPQPPIQQRPEPIPEQAPTPEQPSPEEMEMFLANLQHVLTSLEEDDTVDEAYIYYDDASDDSDVPMNFNEFMHALHGNNY